MISSLRTFDWRCRLHFYHGGLNGEEQRFLAVPNDPGISMVLRGILKTKVPTMADHGRLLGIRMGRLTDLWDDEAVKVGLHGQGIAGNPRWSHDLVLSCVWEPDPIVVPERVLAYWPPQFEV